MYKETSTIDYYFRLGQGDKTNQLQYVQLVSSNKNFISAVKSTLTLEDKCQDKHTDRLSKKSEAGNELFILRLDKEEYEKYLYQQKKQIPVDGQTLEISGEYSFRELQFQHLFIKNILLSFEHLISAFEENPENKTLISYEIQLFSYLKNLLEKNEYGHYIIHPDSIFSALKNQINQALTQITDKQNELNISKNKTQAKITSAKTSKSIFDKIGSLVASVDSAVESTLTKKAHSRLSSLQQTLKSWAILFDTTLQKETEKFRQDNKKNKTNTTSSSTSTIMPERLSFEEWLREKYSVFAKNENTQQFFGLSKEAGINYIFNDLDALEKFKEDLELSAHVSYDPSQEIEFIKDPIYPDQFALYLSPDEHSRVKKAYLNDKQPGRRSPTSDEIQHQIDSLKQREQVLHKLPPSLLERLDRLQSLASNQESGYIPFIATSAFEMSLQNFLALNRDSLSHKEIETLQNFSSILLKLDDKGNVVDGLKAQENWLDYIEKFTLEDPEFQKSIFPRLIKEDAQHRLYGVKDRIVIGANTKCYSKKLTQHELTESEKGGVTTQKILRFLPDPSNNNDSETDEIVLSAGTRATHRTVIAITKEKNINSPGGYDYFQIEYNTGHGADWKNKPKKDPTTSKYSTGIVWGTTKRPIQAIEGKTLEETLEYLIICHRLVSFSKPPRPEKIPTGDNENAYSEPESVSAKNWTTGQEGINKCLAPRIEAKSYASTPQTSGNCAVKSLHEFFADYCRQQLGNTNLAEEHWRFAKENNKKITFQHMAKKIEELEKLQPQLTTAPIPIDLASPSSTASPPQPLAPTTTATPFEPMLLTTTSLTPTPAEPFSNSIVSEALKNSQEWREKFKNILPTENSLDTLIKKGALTREEAAKQLKSVRIILNSRLKPVLTHFLNNKKLYGSSIEKAFYQSMTEEDLILRFFQKRAIVFTNIGGMEDYYILSDMRTGRDNGDDKPFEKVGTDSEGDLKLIDCLSYDEMKLSALIGLASFTSFINKGGRFNNGKPGEENSFEKAGVFIAITGARFEKEGLMEFQDVFVTRKQNTPDNGYGQDLSLNINEKKAKALEPFAKLYRQKNDRYPTYEEVEKIYDSFGDNDKEKCDYIFVQGDYINKSIYKERMRMSLETMLDSAIEFANTQPEKIPFISVPGLGLSPGWSTNMSDELGALQLEAYYELLHEPKYAKIGVLDFNYYCEGEKCIETYTRLFENNPGKLPQQFSYTYGSRKDGSFKQYGQGAGAMLREGSSKVDDKYMLIRILPWDSNAGIGNEIFMGRFDASGDPACACSATVLEVLNGFINKCILQLKNIFYYGNEAAVDAATPAASTPTPYPIGPMTNNTNNTNINHTPAHFQPTGLPLTTQPAVLVPNPDELKTTELRM